MSSPPRIVFAGTPDFALPSLRLLLSAGAEVSLVLTQPDRPAGRGRKLALSPIKAEALARELRVCQPSRLSESHPGENWGPAPDLIIVVAYGLLLPSWLLSWPRLGAVNVHASLLPRWRGAAPIQQAILAGDLETGASIMKMGASLDTGPVFGQRALDIGPQETAGMLHDRLARLGGELLVELLPGILSGELCPAPQDHSKATHAPKISKADAVLDWTRTAEELQRRVRAFNPWPVSETSTVDGERVRIWEAVAVAGAAPAPAGSVVAVSPGGIDVATGDGVLRLLTVQPPGGKVMTAGAYSNAHPLDGKSFVSSE